MNGVNASLADLGLEAERRVLVVADCGVIIRLFKSSRALMRREHQSLGAVRTGTRPDWYWQLGFHEAL